MTEVGEVKRPTMSESEMSEQSDPNSWLQNLPKLNVAYPQIGGFLKRAFGQNIAARQIVRDHYLKYQHRLPGRCVLLTFLHDQVHPRHFESPAELTAFLDDELSHKHGEPRQRLWILEDLVEEWVEILGGRLGVDPMVFSEQTNTFNFTDSETVVTRDLPSMVRPAHAFSLRYFEFRQLKDHESIQSHTNQMTFASNVRRIERWRDIDTLSFKCAWRHSFTRRCASFWSNQTDESSGWDAVMLVDPPYDAFSWKHIQHMNTDACTILQDPMKHKGFDALWAARNQSTLVPTPDISTSYHGGSHTFSKGTLQYADAASRSLVLDPDRNRSSLFDEMVLHWTQIADKELIASARKNSVNSAHYLLKYLANLWMHQLDLVASTISQSEYFSDDYQARVDGRTTTDEWRSKLNEVNAGTVDMNNVRRQMRHFESHLTINLERIGLVLGAFRINLSAPAAIREAQADFIHIFNRLQPFVSRATTIGNTAHELASLHASFKSIQDGELGLRLSIFASIVFPATLVASILSMNDKFLPGEDGQFWIFWAIVLPVIFAAAIIFACGASVTGYVVRHYKALVKNAKVKLKLG